MGAAFDASQSVREILARYPETGPVFERFGLAGCGGAAGPDEPLDFFARVHHVSLEALTAALSAAIDRRPVSAPAAPDAGVRPAAAPPTDGPASHQFAPFLLAALAVTLTLGATLGALNLAKLTGTWGVLLPPSVWAHAYAQVFGFVGLFVMGVAYHVVPRFLGRSLSRATWPTLVLQLGGVLFLSFGYLLADGRLTDGIRVVGAGALVTAAVLFASHIVGIVRVAPRSGERFEPWLVAGALWLIVAAGLALVVAATRDQSWHHVLWPASLFGFAGSWIFGVARRILPVFLGWRTRWRAGAMAIWGAYQAGVIAWSIGAWPDEAWAFAWTRGLGAILLLGAVTAFTVAIGITGRRTTASMDPHGGYEPFIRCAWVWLFVALATGPVWTIGALAAGRYGAILMLDFSSHAMALGFITQMIMGISTRVLPVFTGHALWSQRATRAVFWLVNGAVAIRGLQAIVAAGFWPTAWPLIALSGPLAVAALLLFSLNVVMTLRGGDDVPEAGNLPADLADAIVADLIAIDGVRDALIRAGFTPLANPVMRATFARSITLGQAARLRGLAIETLIETIAPLVAAGRPTARRPAAGSPDASRRIPLKVVNR